MANYGNRKTCAGCRRNLVHFVCGDPDRCPRCYEPMSRVTAGSIKCACQAPRMPRHLKDSDDRPTPAVRYGN